MGALNAGGEDRRSRWKARMSPAAWIFRCARPTPMAQSDQDAHRQLRATGSHIVAGIRGDARALARPYRTQGAKP